jgi:hypothetical protein
VWISIRVVAAFLKKNGNGKIEKSKKSGNGKTVKKAVKWETETLKR